MGLTFGKPVHVESLEGLSAVARQQAWLCWQFTGGDDGDYPDVESMLADLEVRRFEVRDASDTPVADFWQVWDGALLFRAGSTDVVGQAIQHGFTCKDRALWSEVARAAGAPGFIDFTVGDGDGGSLWSPPTLPSSV